MVKSLHTMPVGSLLAALIWTIPLSAQKGNEPESAGEEGAARGPDVLWRQPTDIASRNLFYGPGGEEDAPHSTFTFIKEDLNGTNPKFDVRDENGVKWKVKLGVEARPEVVASRLVWAVGYSTNEDYFLPDLHVQGKTTIISLIARFYDPDSGVVKIDGQDIRRFKHKSLRGRMSFVLQENLLFHAPVWQNIAYGKPEATRAEVLRAAELANAHEFIQQLPEGYDTLVGERGTTLSGGQRQRIAIARAIIRDTPILIMDEPSSGLDASSEKQVFEALDRLMEGKTSIVIAHRLSTIRRSDVIFVVDDGRIAEYGKHEELLESGGLYAELHQIQFAAETEAPVAS